MKNTKLIALVAVLVVVSLVVSIAVALGNDKKAGAQIDDTIKNYEQQIAELNKTIEELNKGLISSTEALEKLQAAGVEIKNWNEASAVLLDKLAELEKAGEDFEESVKVFDEKDEKKENPLVTFEDLYDFSYTQGEETVWHTDKFEELYQNAMMDLVRATSVAEMNTIIANFKADLANVPTILEFYLSTLETVEKDGKVTYDEYETMLVAYEVADQIIDNIYAPAAEGEEKGQKELLAERLDALMAEFKPLVVEKFVELAKALPEVEFVAPSHYEAVEAAAKEAAFVIELYGVDEAKKLETNKKGKATAYGTALDKLAEVEARVVVVKEIEEAAEALNEILAHAFDKKNLESAGIKYGANIETFNYLNAYGDLIAGWVEYWSIVEDEKDEEYNAELYNLVNHNVYEGYVANFEAEVATLRAAAEEFIAAVEAIENVNLDSKATLDAAKVLFDVVSKGQKIEDLDKILELEDEEDEDGELVEVTGVVDSYDAWLTLYHDYNWLVDTKAALEKEVKEALIVCKVKEHGTKDAHGDVIPCTCEKIGEYDLTKITTDFDPAIVKIIAKYGLDETVFDAELLDVYKEARIQETLGDVIALLDEAFKLSKDERKLTLYNVILEEIKETAHNYTFAAEFTCVDPDNKDHECDCAEDLNNWAMAIEGEPAEELAAKYTKDILYNRFGVVVVLE